MILNGCNLSAGSRCTFINSRTWKSRSNNLVSSYTPHKSALPASSNIRNELDSVHGLPFSNLSAASTALLSGDYGGIWHTVPHLSSSKPTSISALPHSKSDLWLSELPSEPLEPIKPEATVVQEEGPIELPFPSGPSIFATSDDPSPLQVATSVLLTGSIGVFLFRALRRRAKRAKELKFRSSGAKKTIQEEALDSLKAMGVAPIEAEKKPSPAQAFLGGLGAAVIALILYKFTTTIEASLNRQTMSDNFSVRQITITIRTIINGLCYLATFVFGLNSLGLFLYSGQLAMNSFMEGSNSEESGSKGNEQSGLVNSASENPADINESNSSNADQKPDDSQK